MIHREGLRLVKPSLQFETEYTNMVREFLQIEEPWFNNFELALEDFPAFVQELQDEALGSKLTCANPFARRRYERVAS